MPKKSYSREFKDSAVKLVHERGYTPVEAAKSLGVDAATLRYWLKKHPAPSGGKIADGAIRERRRATPVAPSLRS